MGPEETDLQYKDNEKKVQRNHIVKNTKQKYRGGGGRGEGSRGLLPYLEIFHQL